MLEENGVVDAVDALSCPVSSQDHDTVLFSSSPGVKGPQGITFGSSNVFTRTMESADITLQRKMESAQVRQQKLMDLGLFSSEFKSRLEAEGEDTENVSNTLFREDFNRFSNAESELKSHRASDMASTPSTRGRQNSNAVQKTTYQDFLNKLMHPSCEVLVNALRQFLFSILGPNGDGTPPDIDINEKKTKKTHVSGYEFHGAQDVQRRCSDFLDSLIDHMRKHPFWNQESVEEMTFSRDCLERYITIKIYDVAFNSCEVPEEDEVLARRAQMLAFLTPDAFDIKPELRNDLVFSLAQDKLKKINSFKAPADKVNCIVR